MFQNINSSDTPATTWNNTKIDHIVIGIISGLYVQIANNISSTFVYTAPESDHYLFGVDIDVLPVQSDVFKYFGVFSSIYLTKDDTIMTLFNNHNENPDMISYEDGRVVLQTKCFPD